MRVLFVDDESRVLEAIERVLLELATDWETCFVGSGELALTELSRANFDVIVSDLRMPGMDGVALLSRVAQQHPRVVRIVLSGHSDEEAALKMVNVTHQFLAKPCAAETLHQIIARTQQLSSLLPDRKLQTMVCQIGALPCATNCYAELLQLIERDDTETTAAALARVIKQDPAMTSKLLQVASSAFFNTSASVADVETAIMRLGLRTLKNLILTLGTESLEAGAGGPMADAVQSLQARALRVAQLASSMVRLPEDAASAYIAGLLSDVGQLVLACAAPERQYLTQAEAAQRGESTHRVELETWGTTHAELGAYLLGLWGLPAQIVAAVAHHHAPERAVDERLGLAHLVWLASCIVDGEQPPLDLLSRFGAEQLYATHRRAFQEREA